MTSGQQAYYAARNTSTPELRVDFNYDLKIPHGLEDETYDRHFVREDEEMETPEVFGAMAKDILDVYGRLQSAQLSPEAAKVEWDHASRNLAGGGQLKEVGRHEGISQIFESDPFSETTLKRAIIQMEEELTLSPELVDGLTKLVERAETFVQKRDAWRQERHTILRDFHME